MRIGGDSKFLCFYYSKVSKLAFEKAVLLTFRGLALLYLLSFWYPYRATSKSFEILCFKVVFESVERWSDDIFKVFLHVFFLFHG